MILISSWSRLCPILWRQVLSREWRCSWSSANRRCSNYIWVIDNLIAYKGASYIRLYCQRYFQVCVWNMALGGHIFRPFRTRKRAERGGNSGFWPFFLKRFYCVTMKRGLQVYQRYSQVCIKNGLLKWPIEGHILGFFWNPKRAEISQNSGF